jgi:hypothetical protein
MRLGTNIYDRGKPKKSSQSANKRLEFEVGNLQVQVAEYQQIIKELSDKIKLYEQKYGSVFKKSNTTTNN